MVFAVAQEFQHGDDWRIALPKRHVVALIFLAVLDVYGDDVLMVLFEEIDRVKAGSIEMPDIQVDFDPLRTPLHRLHKAFGRGKLAVADPGMPVESHIYLVLLAVGIKLFRHRYRG